MPQNQLTEVVGGVMVGMVGKYAGALVLVRMAPLEEASLRYLELYRFDFFEIGI